MSAFPTAPSFHLFPLLPPELRLKIWHLTLTPRIVEVQLHAPLTHSSYDSTAHTMFDLRPFTGPAVPSAFHACHESRALALGAYRPCAGSTFGSAHAFPYNLYQPALDTVFLPISLYSLEASWPQNMYSAGAAHALGMPREFVLDRLAAGGPVDVSEVRYLAISWQDMHLKDVETLAQALAPYVALRELALVFFEMRKDYQDVRLLLAKRGHSRATFVDPEEGMVKGRFLARVLEEFTELAAAFNDSFSETNAIKEADGEARARKMPQVKVKMVRFEPLF